MRILHLNDTLTNSANGINNVVVDLAIRQAQQGHTVHIASAGGDFTPLVEAYGVETSVLDFRRRSPRALPLLMLRLRTLLRAFRADVVHSHTLTPALLAALAAPLTPRVATVHNEFQRGVGVMGLSHVVVCVSRANERDFGRRLLCWGRTTTIQNAPLGSPRREGAVAPAPLEGTAVIAVGSITRRKGSDLVVEAFGRVACTRPDAHLYFVGNLDEPDVLAPARGQEWEDRIHLAGSVPDPRAYMLGASIAVAASRREPFGLVVIEEREAGLACVVSSADGLPEVAGFGAAARIFPSGDVDRLAAELALLLDDEEVREEYAARAVLDLDHFDVSRMTREYLDVYGALLERRFPRRRPFENKSRRT
ncbi:glycosyltransferase family 4 protein [Rathayibacter sp. SD072]|uniref:glycosyltransferase family 4 protein n=1 Tax=Rathayibacter sp. SD072 TaxID=2781731 RepID=UPI001A95D0DB|nr:glycosyltransferase family 4 protein [Rathayibacter sp. SD072]MBO0982874.1 glycosyltransferase family 4 protein [Rathayibacter sp. SD072]